MASQRTPHDPIDPTDMVPATRAVPHLETALRRVRRLGGTVVSEVRTAPGIGSWAFVADTDGRELVLWQHAAAARA